MDKQELFSRAKEAIVDADESKALGLIAEAKMRILTFLNYCYLDLEPVIRKSGRDSIRVFYLCLN